ncbi:MAG: 3-hydroxyacyl-CoA dehydrogenase/enoyl-CoA hydratase family protein [Candidatus Poribacteria bacterium]|nr:3-hydroxyacyl-CoA dehydrogenase/enoyl-CoA hydratase family protein [Candidatus Poribacteria bacterium]
MAEKLYRKIRKVAVVGAGTMGSQIAAHIANVGIPCDLLDILPTELTTEERANNLTLDSPAVRNRIAQSALDRMKSAKTRSPFYLPDAAQPIRVGNLNDHAAWLADADWVIEAVVENLNVKKQVHARIDLHRKRGTLVTSNTSGISIRSIAEDLPEDYQECFMGTHFFNPPRYMYLLEIIPTDKTRPELVEFIVDFGERVLGKGIVRCKDTPNFIANRVGAFAIMHAIHLMLEAGLTIDEVDAITGPPLGRPRSATFRLGDLIGIDILVDVANNLYECVPDDEQRGLFRIPDFVSRMVEKNWLGDKTGQGFYHKRPGERGSEIWTLDYNSLEYIPRAQIEFDSLDAVKRIPDAGQRIKQLVNSGDRAGEFAWKCISNVMIYAASRIPEISEDLVSIDNVMKWGFNWEIGVFEMWDAIGVPESVERMRSEGHAIPPLVTNLLNAGQRSFYNRAGGARAYFDLGTSDYREIESRPEVILLSDSKANGKVVKSNADASLIDIGDGVACLEFHGKMNTIDLPTIEMMVEALDEVKQNFEGLVIGNHAVNFSVGANLVLMLQRARNKDWDALGRMGRAFQDADMALRLSPKPVVAAPAGMAFGGGCEITLGADRVCAAAETYIGLVELRVGLIPGAGGTKEMAIRCLEGVPLDAGGDPFPHVKRAFETIAYSKVSESGAHAKTLGYLRDADKISINHAHHLYDAKQMVLSMAADGYQQPQPRMPFVLGEAGLAQFKLEIHLMRRAAYISDHDVKVVNQLAYVLCGGKLSAPQFVSEQYLLDLEREAFLSLCGEEKTQQRIEYTLKTGRPLRN